MKRLLGLLLATTLILGGCSTMENESKKDTKTETKSVPDEMEASKYVGQGFQPPAEKDAIEFAKKHLMAQLIQSAFSQINIFRQSLLPLDYDALDK